jgi:hypothetical protein
VSSEKPRRAIQRHSGLEGAGRAVDVVVREDQASHDSLHAAQAIPGRARAADYLSLQLSLAHGEFRLFLFIGIVRRARIRCHPLVKGRLQLVESQVSGMVRKWDSPLALNLDRRA